MFWVFTGPQIDQEEQESPRCEYYSLFKQGRILSAKCHTPIEPCHHSFLDKFIEIKDKLPPKECSGGVCWNSKEKTISDKSYQLL